MADARDGEPDAVPRVLAEDLGHRLARLMQSLGTHEILALQPFGLTLRSYGVLAVAAEAALSQQEVSRVTGIDRTSVVAIVDELEAAGLVTREPDPEDRRARRIRATDRGHDVAAEAVSAVRAVEDGFLAPLPAELREQVWHAVALMATGPLAEPADLTHVPSVPRRRTRRGEPG